MIRGIRDAHFHKGGDRHPEAFLEFKVLLKVNNGFVLMTSLVCTRFHPPGLAQQACLSSFPPMSVLGVGNTCFMTGTAKWLQRKHLHILIL